jgi:hypothetical protein
MLCYIAPRTYGDRETRHPNSYETATGIVGSPSCDLRFRNKEWKRSENLKRLNDYAAAHPPTAEQAAALNRKAGEKAKMQNLLNKLVDEDPNKCWDPLKLSKLPKQPPTIT